MNLFPKSLIVSFYVLLSVSVQAEAFSYGIMMGPNISSLKMKNVPSSIEYNAMYAPVLGYNLNGFISYRSKSYWGISIEPGFVNKGGIQLFDYYNSQYKAIRYKVIDEFNSIEFPILLDLYFGNHVYLSTGLVYEYRLSARAIMTDQPTMNDGSILLTKSLYNNLANNDGLIHGSSLDNDILPDEDRRISITGLVGLYYKINSRFDLGMRYGKGLKELLTVNWTKNGYPLGMSTVYNDYLQFVFKVRI